MKKISFFAFLMIAALAGMLTSCESYDMASISLEKLCPFNDTTRIVQYIAQVTDDGGCPHCIEAGYCFSYIDTMPSHTLYYTTVVPMIYDSLMSFTDSTKYLTFSWSRQLPFIESADAGTLGNENDTLIYYFRSYISTNAGTFYSPVDTVGVPRSY